ncbi:MAG TPA: fumarylacetoacetate hydrolase family protein, partial [Puia sp.]
MKLVTYLKEEHEQVALLVDGMVYDVDLVHPDIPNTISMCLNYWDELFPVLQAGELAIGEGHISTRKALSLESVQLIAPIPFPPSCRDGYAFRQHVASARRNRNAPMIAEFDQYPVFYFTNHHGIQGPGDIRCMPDHLEKLDFELEVAIVIGRPGRNILAEGADQYIAGL